jgi:hypothetical protein
MGAERTVSITFQAVIVRGTSVNDDELIRTRKTSQSLFELQEKLVGIVRCCWWMVLNFDGLRWQLSCLVKWVRKTMANLQRIRLKPRENRHQTHSFLFTSNYLLRSTKSKFEAFKSSGICLNSQVGTHLKQKSLDTSQTNKSGNIQIDRYS